jgi:hypothetical protein
VHFFKELHERFQPAGKKTVFYAACLMIGPAWFLGNRLKLQICLGIFWIQYPIKLFIHREPISDSYFNSIGPYVEHIVLEMTPQGGLQKATAEPVYSLFRIVRLHNQV